jgi:hypothetical protein
MPRPDQALNILCQNQHKRQSAFAQCRPMLNRAREQNRANWRKVRLLMIGPALVIGPVVALTGKNHVS